MPHHMPKISCLFILFCFCDLELSWMFLLGSCYLYIHIFPVVSLVSGTSDCPKYQWSKPEGYGYIGAGIILCMRPANERRRYIITSSLIGWAHTENYLWRSEINETKAWQWMDHVHIFRWHCIFPKLTTTGLTTLRSEGRHNVNFLLSPVTSEVAFMITAVVASNDKFWYLDDCWV